MHIQTINSEDLPEGTIAEVVRGFKHCYHVIWRSAAGSFKAKVMKKNCVVLFAMPDSLNEVE